ncbi:magnesium-dependent phosphatase 1-like [Diabrotica undecimpunctata]|uniref:magnesium-dependent phosphatase 1-like n=1 Tax=Diabrotica undecimpunctata TaxID=50387 RepID=UPI003B63C09C
MASNNLKMMVFDLDFTLWPFWVDTHVSPPFKKNSNGVVVDSYNSEIEYYPQVPEILQKLYDEGYTLGVASRTSEIKGAKQLLQMFGWDKYFSYLEIFPGRKTTHFNNLKEQSGIDFEEMIFFDDELRNIHDVSALGVVSVFVKKGVDKSVIEEGKQQFASGVKKSIR